MGKLSLRRAGRLAGIAVGGVVLLLGMEILLALPGPDDHFQNPSRQPVRLGGRGKPLVYVVLGDSTAAGRGGQYDRGIAMGTARHLARSQPFLLVNLAVSGAKVSDVLRDQLPAAVRLKPDLVLVAVGGNDVTHFTPSSTIASELSSLIRGLAAARPGVRIVLTGSPDVGTARRFAQPLRWITGLETERVNRVFESVAGQEQGSGEVVWAPLARETGPAFARDASLLAPDRFHPNDRGYAVWLPVLNTALDKACPKDHPNYGR